MNPELLEVALRPLVEKIVEEIELSTKDIYMQIQKAF
jgi:hypothetical protein